MFAFYSFDTRVCTKISHLCLVQPTVLQPRRDNLSRSPDGSVEREREQDTRRIYDNDNIE